MITLLSYGQNGMELDWNGISMELNWNGIGMELEFFYLCLFHVEPKLITPLLSSELRSNTLYKHTVT